MRVRFFALWLALGLMPTISMATPLDLLVNGSFESPDISDFWTTRQPALGDLISNTPGLWVQYQAGNTENTGWTVTQGNVDVVRNEWPAFAGSQSVDLVGFVLGGLQQSFSTTPGAFYHFSFEYANNPSNGGGMAQIDIIGQANLLSDTVGHWNSSNPNLNWVNYSADFVADSNTTTLRFTALTQSSAGGVVIDNVSVIQSVPEPASIVMVTTALAVIAMRKRLITRR